MCATFEVAGSGCVRHAWDTRTINRGVLSTGNSTARWIKPLPRAGMAYHRHNYRGGLDEAGMLVGRTAMLVLGHPEPNAI